MKRKEAGRAISGTSCVAVGSSRVAAWVLWPGGCDRAVSLPSARLRQLAMDCAVALQSPTPLAHDWTSTTYSLFHQVTHAEPPHRWLTARDFDIAGLSFLLNQGGPEAREAWFRMLHENPPLDSPSRAITSRRWHRRMRRWHKPSGYQARARLLLVSMSTPHVAPVWSALGAIATPVKQMVRR